MPKSSSLGIAVLGIATITAGLDLGVDPSMVDKTMIGKRSDDRGMHQDRIYIVTGVSSGIGAETADVAPVVSLLLAENSRWFRGANLTVDGGMSSHILCNIHQL